AAAAQAAQGPGGRRPLAQARGPRAAAAVGRAAAAHPHPGRIPGPPARGAGGAQPRRLRAPAPAPGLVPGGRGQRDPRAAGVLRAPQGLFAAGRPGVNPGAPAAASTHATPGRRRPGVLLCGLALALAGAPAAGQVTATSEYLERMDSDG